MRKILYVSGTRADYGPARRLLLALQDDAECELSLIVTGMHLDTVHGETWREIQRDGLNIVERLYGRVAGDSLTAMVASIGLYLYGMSQIVARLEPDIVLVLGDRGEQLAGAMAAAFQNITVVHLCGGAISGSIDDSIRHATTKFAHYHLTGFHEHARRIEQLGEDPDSIHVVGIPGGDLSADVAIARGEVCCRYQLSEDLPYILLIQHPETHSHNEISEQIVETLEALAELPYPALLANPNDDAGGREILTCMQNYATRYPHLRLLPPPSSREWFASIMAHAGALVGNSSSGLVEAMSVELPVVNIGDRQKGREHLAHWINVKHERNEIRQAIEQALGDEAYRAGLHRFSAGLKKKKTEAMIIDLLKSVDLEIGQRNKPFFWSARRGVMLTAQEKPCACFVGVRLEALLALERYVHIESVITVADSRVHRHCKEVGRTLQLTDRNERALSFDAISRQNVDIVFSAGFPFILPNEILQGKAQFINSHPSLLPAYKGYNAIKMAFDAGELYMGATVHYMVEEVDAGAQIAQERVWVQGLALDQIYELLFSVVEPMAISRALEKLMRDSEAD